MDFTVGGNPVEKKVTSYCLLPDTICGDCIQQIDNFHAFIKKSLQNILIFETHFNIQESCLKSKQKHDKSCYTNFDHKKLDQSIQTEEYLDVISGKSLDYEKFCEKFPKTFKFTEKLPNIVDYNVDSDDSNSSGIKENNGKVVFPSCSSVTPTGYYEQLNISKEKLNQEDISDLVETMETENKSFEDIEMQLNRSQREPLATPTLPRSLHLCRGQLSSSSTVSSLMSDQNEFDINEAECINEKPKKKLPNLVKISDLKRTDSHDDSKSPNNQHEEPPRLVPSFVCSNCPGEFTNKSDLLFHSQLKHSQQAAYICGLCTHQCTSATNLDKHIQDCSQTHRSNNKFVCRICKHGDDNHECLEKHIPVHQFLLDSCRKQSTVFDPKDYIDRNENFEESNSLSGVKNLNCSECDFVGFQTYKEFSQHKRNQHDIFHCDLCSKRYGRNSHLWKHVNRVHKGHPSVTCRLCLKTSASKYHLAQHINRTHCSKDSKQRVVVSKEDSEDEDEKDEHQVLPSDLIKVEIKAEGTDIPKEIDPSHNLYNNIITNYTPSPEGEFRCQKCSRTFNARGLLKKHRKNCRPKSQKDLLTRCKSCSRVFKDRQSLAKHLINYHSEYICDICSQKVQSKCEIIAHIRFQHPICDLICKTCQSVLRTPSDMRTHLQNHSESHICQFCGDDLCSKIKLKMHILSLHRKILSLSCGICLKLFENQYVLRDHVAMLHSEKLSSFTSCKVCGKNYGSKWRTYDHINKSHGKAFRACRTCLEIFKNDAQLQAHCDVTSHGPSSGFNTSVLRDTIMAIVKSVVEQNVENNNDKHLNVQDANSEQQSTTDTEHTHFMTPDVQLPVSERHMLGKRSLQGGLQELIQPINKSCKTTVELNAIPTSSKRTVYIKGDDPASCEICLKSWPAKKHLWQHYIRCHKLAAATVCGICLKTNDSYTILQRHLQESHPNLLHGRGFGSNFICKICGRYHNASSKLRLHMMIHKNFDWTLLERPPTDVAQNGINYESMIEKVEWSSDSENGVD